MGSRGDIVSGLGGSFVLRDGRGIGASDRNLQSGVGRPLFQDSHITTRIRTAPQ